MRARACCYFFDRFLGGALPVVFRISLHMIRLYQLQILFSVRGVCPSFRCIQVGLGGWRYLFSRFAKRTSSFVFLRRLSTVVLCCEGRVSRPFMSSMRRGFFPQRFAAPPNFVESECPCSNSRHFQLLLFLSAPNVGRESAACSTTPSLGTLILLLATTGSKPGSRRSSAARRSS